MRDMKSFRAIIEEIRRGLINDIKRIDKILKQMDKMAKGVYCPKCFGRDIRHLVRNHLFCKGCGYDSRTKKERKR